MILVGQEASAWPAQPDPDDHSPEDRDESDLENYVEKTRLKEPTPTGKIISGRPEIGLILKVFKLRFKKRQTP